MATASLQLYSTFDPREIHFGAPDKNAKGGKFVPLVGADGSRRRWVIQTPALVMPFGVSVFRDRPDSEAQSYSIDVSFRNLESSPKEAEFLDKMRQMDAHLLDCSVAKSKDWFGKLKSKDVLEDNYRKLIKDHPEFKYPPVMKVKVPMRDGVPQTKFFDEKRQETSIDYLVKGTQIKLILEVDRVWFVNSLFGVTWRALQGYVVSRPSRMDAYSFLDDDDEADDPDGLDGDGGLGGLNGLGGLDAAPLPLDAMDS
jgi:hypothetical protein